jgi:ATP-binding cassette, subfamily B, bacterial PglK
LLLIPMAVMTGLEVVSIGLILPVIQVLILDQQDGAITGLIVDMLRLDDGTSPGPWVAGFFVVFFTLKNILLLILIYIVNQVVANKTAIYSRILFDIYLSRPMVFHFHHNSADLLVNVTSGVRRSLETVRLILLLGLDAMLMVGACALLIYVEPVATMAAATILGIIGLSYYKISSPVFKYWGESTLELERTFIKWINQSFDGIRDAKLLQAQGYLSRKIGKTALRFAHFQGLSTTALHIPRLLIETIVIIGFLGIVLVLLSAEQKPAEIISILGLFGMASLRLMPSLNRILTSASALRHSAAYISTVYDDFCNDSAHDSLGKGNDSHPQFPFRENIHLKNISYTYPDAEHHALHNIDMIISKGQSVGFVGTSGAGKSTLMDIVLGLLEPTGGQMLIDNKNTIVDITSWQRNIGFVPQQVFLIDDTIRRNIAFGVEDENIDEAHIEKALQLARLDEFIASLPEGLSAIIGEHGTRLSGGQRQRIAIARALYRDPGVLVFDEATSALDNVTEQDITRAIETLSGDKTILIVAHRLSTVRKCDKIVFMKEGRIEAFGTYEDLLQGNDEFRHLAQLGQHLHHTDENPVP